MPFAAVTWTIHNAARRGPPVLAALAGLSACTAPAPPPPDVAAAQHRYEMGCRPEDAEGYEHLMPYCGHRDLLDGGAR